MIIFLLIRNILLSMMDKANLGRLDSNNLSNVFAIGVLLLIYINIFATHFYNKVPVTLGGGKFQEAQFLIKNKTDAISKILKFENNTSSLTTPYRFLQTDESFLIFIDEKKNKTFQLDKEATDGFISNYTLDK